MAFMAVIIRCTGYPALNGSCYILRKTGVFIQNKLTGLISSGK
jgi:hypothetical protein